MQFAFADHTLDTDTRELRRCGALIAVQPKIFDLLIYLVQNRERVVSKDRLFAAVWNNRTVADSTLGTHINAARRAIGDNGEEQRLIRTIARKGFRFVGHVRSRPGDYELTLASGFPVQSFRACLLASDRPAIAVLPFVNMSGDAKQDYFSDGISEDIIMALSKMRWFFVIARNSAFSYKGKSVHAKQIADELGVGYIVEGSVRKDGDRLRITVQLNDVTSGKQLWAERYDRKFSDVFAVQDEITDAIAAAIEPRLYTAENVRAQRKPPESLDAWDIVMRALWHFWRVTRADNLLAQMLVEHAIAIDPNYAQALALSAVSHTFAAHMGWEDAATATPIARQAALSAVRADGEDPWAHLALACAYAYTGMIDQSLAAFEAALRLNPNFSLAHGSYGLVLSWVGRSRDGAEAVGRALRLSPRDPFSAIYHGVAAYAAFVERDYWEAIRLAREGVRQRKDFVGAHRVLTAAAGMAGEVDLASATLQELRRAQPNVSLAWVASQLPLKLEQERDHFLEGLRRAGLN